MTVGRFRKRKGGEPLVCLTAYTAPVAARLDPHCDLLLVGDSVAMVLHGHETTLHATLDMMILHGKAVMRGASRSLVVVELPFGTYEQSPEQAFANAVTLMQETGCGAVKIEGGRRMADTIRFLVSRNIPVMAHIGLTPQNVLVEGGYKTTGRHRAEWAALEDDARAVAEAGAFSVVFEGMAEPLAAELTGKIAIPTIGIGASAACDGQILVTDDMLGMNDRVPNFVKTRDTFGPRIDAAAAAYAEEVRARRFPAAEHTYKMAE
jgi:3-methyl-2-oxobutanoate hydroxymethyltransferase